MWPYDKNLNQGEFELCIVLNPPLKGSHVYTCLKSSGKVEELTLEAYPTLYEPFWKWKYLPVTYSESFMMVERLSF